MSEGLPCYRAYRLGADDGIADVAVIEARDDAEALAIVHTMRSWHGFELWDRDRQIGRVAPLAMSVATAA